MIAPRWRKVLRDIQERPGRSLLAVLAMAAGVFEIGALTYKYAVLQPVLTTMYGRTLPAAATLVVDGVSDALIDSVRRVSGVADAEARPVVMARVRVGEDEWVPAMFSVVRDYAHLRTDTFEPNAGAWPPGTGDVLLERTALSVAQVKVGDSVTVRTAGGDELSLRVAGTVYAAGLPPSWMEHFVPGFVAWNTPLRGEDHGETAQIRIRVADHPLDEGYIREVADSVKVMLERTGYSVSRVNVPIPGRHPHADQMDAFLYLLSGFGILSFVLSSALVASMVHALLGEQIREVGILKAIGATTRQIAGLYLGQVALLSVASLVVGVPLGLWVGRAYAQFSAQILNADITATPFPWWVVALVVVVGILLPLLFALGPVYRGSRITVQQALAGDVSASWFGSRRLDRWLLKARGLPRPLLLSMRTTLLRRGRLALTVGMLAMGGGAFISALNVSGAWTHELMEDFGRRHYDLTVGLAEPTSIARLEALLAQQPEVEHAEYWAESGPYLIGASGVAGGTVAMIGQETGSRLLDLPLLAGRWLGPGDSTGVVINRGIVARNPKLAVGDQVALRFEGRTVAYPIVGVVKELTPMPAVYALRPTVLALTGRPATLTRSIRIVTREHDESAQRAAAKSLEHELQTNGIEVRGMQRMLDARQGILDHLVIIFSVLTMASAIVVIVAALGLTSTLTLNVVQRTREIGVLSAIGATPSTISRHVWFEGVGIGVLSWAVACAVAAPISAVLEAVVGDIFFKAPLDFYLSWSAAAVWLAIVVVVGSASSFYPAWRAARLTVRQALNTA